MPCLLRTTVFLSYHWSPVWQIQQYVKYTLHGRKKALSIKTPKFNTPNMVLYKVKMDSEWKNKVTVDNKLTKSCHQPDNFISSSLQSCSSTSASLLPVPSECTSWFLSRYCSNTPPGLCLESRRQTPAIIYTKDLSMYSSYWQKWTISVHTACICCMNAHLTDIFYWQT